jgi:hypothetical protein
VYRNTDRPYYRRNGDVRELLINDDLPHAYLEDIILFNSGTTYKHCLALFPPCLNFSFIFLNNPLLFLEEKLNYKAFPLVEYKSGNLISLCGTQRGNFSITTQTEIKCKIFLHTTLTRYHTANSRIIPRYIHTYTHT